MSNQGQLLTSALDKATLSRLYARNIIIVLNKVFGYCIHHQIL
ncbi:hypothetical protein M23134_02604 [Microscilla marina ATCC 23134]|uniref:Uncharacterized protein n=1 Tax=Microscilla marina ATCC 23134 TaxID=313606 RepID=A1ZNP6_MICM2|nr:hypothetical protein M23134_02604 [Microscilla marina ATCC 23134]